MANKRRSFRLTQAQAEVVINGLCYFLATTEGQPQWKAHHQIIENLVLKLMNYNWEVEKWDTPSTT